MSGFDAKRIFQREMVKIWKNAFVNPKWSKTKFSAKTCIPWGTLMQKAFSVLRHGQLKTAFRQILTNSCWKMGSASNRVMQYNSFLKTVFCAILGLKTAFFKIFTIFRWKMRFASDPVMEYNFIFKTVFCSILGWKQLFNKCSPFVAKNAFCIKSIHGIQIFLKNCVCSIFGWTFFKIFYHFSLKNAILIRSSHGNNSFFKTMSCSIVDWKQRFVKFLPFLAEKCVLTQTYSWNNTLSWKLCFGPFLVENSVLQKFHHLSLKKGFSIKSTHGFQNCVLIHFGFIRAFRQVFTISCWKIQKNPNPVMK